MSDKTDPLCGWSVEDLQQTVWIASNDLYGKLYKHLYTLIFKMLRRLTTSKAHFHLFNMDVEDLPRHLDKNRYARIEVSQLIFLVWPN